MFGDKLVKRGKERRRDAAQVEDESLPIAAPERAGRDIFRHLIHKNKKTTFLLLHYDSAGPLKDS